MSRCREKCRGSGSIMRKGSITVEASLCVPIFFLVLFSLFYYLNILLGINTVQTDLADVTGKYECGIPDCTLQTSDGYYIKKKDGDCTERIYYVDYEIKIPFISNRIMPVNLYQQMAASSFSGRSMKSNEDDNETYVYITDSGTVYHRNPECSYLNPSIEKLFLCDVNTKRNTSGGKYYECEICCDDILSENTCVYITKYGNRYHKTKKCSGIKRTVYRIGLSQLNNMRPCSKCGN